MTAYANNLGMMLTTPAVHELVNSYYDYRSGEPVEQHLDLRMTPRQLTEMGALRWAAWVEFNVIHHTHVWGRRDFEHPGRPCMTVRLQVEGSPDFTFTSRQTREQAREALVGWMRQHAATFRWPVRDVDEIAEHGNEPCTVLQERHENARGR